MRSSEHPELMKTNVLKKKRLILLFTVLLMFCTPTGSTAGERMLAQLPDGLPSQLPEASAVAPTVQEIAYSVHVVEKADNSRLVLECVLEGSHYNSAIHTLSDKIYGENEGGQYEQVIINWRLKGRENGKSPWAPTCLVRNSSDAA